MEEEKEQEDVLMMEFMAEVDERLTKIEQFLNIE